MSSVRLHGTLGEKYGEEFHLAAHSVLESIQLLGASFPGFLADLMESESGFVVTVDGVEMRSVSDLYAKHINPDIHIVPAVKGAGGDNGGFSQILLAAAIAVATYYAGPAGAGWLSASTQSIGYSLAINMAINGVISMLVAGQQDNDLQGALSEEELTSYAFSGAVNTVAQGNPVPVVYGRLRVGSQVISAGVSTSA